MTNLFGYGVLKEDLKFNVDRDWQQSFCDQLDDMGFNSYGEYELDEFYYGEDMTETDLGVVTRKILEGSVRSEYNNSYYYYENDTFIIMPYYWGDDDDISDLPNFVHKNTGFTMSWYKYPLRGARMSQDINWTSMKNILLDCKRSMGISMKKDAALNHTDWLYKENLGEKEFKVVEEVFIERLKHTDPDDESTIDTYTNILGYLNYLKKQENS